MDDDALDALLRPADPHQDARRARPTHPKGWEPGYSWDGSHGVITTAPLADRPRTWDEFIRDSGLNPDEVEVLEPVQVRGWDMPTRGGVVRAHYYRLTVRRRSGSASVDELVKRIGRRRPPKERPTGDAAFMVLVGDTQFGKMDGDGVAGTVDRFLAKTDAAVARLKARRREGYSIGPVYLAWLGDCIEGFQSQGGRLAWRNTLTLTEQVRLYRRMLLHQVEQFAPLTDRLVIASVPGNHDEAVRTGDKMSTRYDDSWAIEGAAAVHDALRLNPDAYGHVTLVVPPRDELTLTLDVCGTAVGLAHGHQFRGGWEKWWAGQAHGRQPIGDADLLLAGHLHHWVSQDTGGGKTFIQVPALDGGSTWFRHGNGEEARAGMVTLVVGEGGWLDRPYL